MAFCSECGEKINKDDVFCKKCGSKQVKSKIKLVAARCPSCGSNIDVDKNKETTICEYCNTRIIIDDAIEKYKIEISGEVEIKNLPKLQNILKNANRNYDNGEYVEALENYTAALSLDPDNSLAILRRGICKSITSDYFSLDVMAIANGLKDSMQFQLSDEENTKYVSESINAMSQIHNFVMNYYYGLKRYPLDDVEKYLNIQNLCLNAWGGIVTHVRSSEDKLICYTFMVTSLIELIFTRNYASGRYYNGMEINYRYNHDKTIQKSRIELAKYYIDLVKQINIEKGLELEKKLNDSINKEFGCVTWIILTIVMLIMIWMCFAYNIF